MGQRKTKNRYLLQFAEKQNLLDETKNKLQSEVGAIQNRIEELTVKFNL